MPTATEQSFEGQVCDALHAETGYLYSPVAGTMGAEYLDEYGTRVQLLPSAQFASHVREQLDANSNLPENEDEADQVIERDVNDIPTIIIQTGGNVERFGVIDLSAGKFLNT